VDPDVAQLVREQRLLEAARLASERGHAHDASAIYERACEWRSAAAEAMRAGAAARALELALCGGDESTAEGALALLVQDKAAAVAVAARLARRGQDTWAARVLERCGRPVDAARAWERAGEARRAAALLERAGEPADAERVLQAALRRDPNAWRLAVTLGALLRRFGKWEATVRVLQRIPEGTPERCEALFHLADALNHLGLGHAASEVTAELDSLGQTVTSRSTHVVVEPAPSHRARLFGQYDLIREVASSPSARVLQCVDVLRGERVAVKMLATTEARGSGRDALARFEREVRAMKSLEHPNVVPLRDFVPEGPALVLAWMEGGSLERMLAARGAIAPARAVEIACSVLSALGAAHRLGILHRDVKPANVLFDEAGGARLSDFGVAHLDDVSTTATAGVFGTLAYMSPEQRAGRPASAASDVFAVGVMLREMLTGERPSARETPRLEPSDVHRDLDVRHDTAVSRMTAQWADDRMADAFEARALLAALPWPEVVDAASAPRAQHKSSPRPNSGTFPRAPERSQPPEGTSASVPQSDPRLPERLELGRDGMLMDLWTGRTIEPIALSERSLMRARSFALADHPALQTVWRVDQAHAAIWLEALDAPELARPLTPEERARLREALDALHANGGVHGRVDAQHMVLGPSGIVLRFEAEHDATATADHDSLALARMSGAPHR
jgi:serine/threonine protein kinase